MTSYNQHTQGRGGKIILVIGCLHGHELIGKRVIEELRRLSISGGTLITVIANTRAIKAGKRFIDQDLNRSFPGSPQGNYEERLASALMPLLNKADVVIDIHSTTVGLTSSIILTKVNKSIRELLLTFNPKRVIVMEKKVGKTALTGHCRTGLSFEYGADKSERAYKETLKDIVSILDGYGVSTGKKKTSLRISPQTEYFESVGSLVRPAGFRLKKTIKNFALVKKGEVVAQKGSETQKALHDFYPFLFREKSYKEIWGFMAKKVKSI